MPERVINSVKELTEFLSLNIIKNNDKGGKGRENINVQQIETFMKNEGFQDSEAILPNFEFNEILTTGKPQVTTTKQSLVKQVDDQFIRSLLSRL